MCGEAGDEDLEYNISSSDDPILQTGYVTEEECSKWPREVCTVRKELKAKFNPVTKCEKVKSITNTGE